LQETEGAEAVDRAEWNSTLALVHDMFPNIDGDVVELVFESNRGVVSRTIEQLLEMSMGNEAEQVAREHEGAANDGGVARSSHVVISSDVAESNDVTGNYDVVGSYDVLQQAAASVGGENDVDEMERWKGHWADDDGSDYEADADNEPLSAHNGPVSQGGLTEPDSAPQGPIDTQGQDQDEEQDHGVQLPDQDEDQDQVVPDTSKDAELARKLQQEFEQQEFEQDQQRQP
ncbi:hypothetical protein IWW50_006734, partial [Coemansia erecta]